MSRRVKILLGLLISVVTLLCVAGICLFVAVRHVPEFYSQALSQKPVELTQGSDQLIRRAATLSNDLDKSGDWQAIFSDAEINGWLAVDLPKNHPHLLPPEFVDPRVCIKKDGILIAARLESGVNAVVSLEFDLKLNKNNEIAVRIRKARFGDIPWGLSSVVDSIVEGSREAGIKVRQSQIDDDPLLEFSLASLTDPDEKEMRVEKLELRNGEVFVAGKTFEPAIQQARKPTTGTLKGRLAIPR
ncbi:MAG: hypothetical protein SGJ20_00655 [Planctomycetota bacterium]|nr:hypothetical protein [Planctomycetota bacterium]